MYRYGLRATFHELDQACLETILSLTSAWDVSRFSSVSRFWNKAATTDFVWRQFLPSHADWLCRNSANQESLTVVKPRTLVQKFREGILSADGKQLVRADLRTGKVRHHVSAAESLSIAWGDDKRFWKKKEGVSGATFEKTPTVLQICWLQVGGGVKCHVTPGKYKISWRLGLDPVAANQCSFTLMFEATFGNGAEAKKTVQIKNPKARPSDFPLFPNEDDEAWGVDVVEREGERERERELVGEREREQDREQERKEHMGRNWVSHLEGEKQPGKKRRIEENNKIEPEEISMMSLREAVDADGKGVDQIGEISRMFLLDGEVDVKMVETRKGESSERLMEYMRMFERTLNEVYVPWREVEIGIVEVEPVENELSLLEFHVSLKEFCHWKSGLMLDSIVIEQIG